MSTNLLPVLPENEHDRTVLMTQFCGPSRAEGEDRKRLQLTQGERFINVSNEQAAELAFALLEWAHDMRDVE